MDVAPPLEPSILIRHQARRGWRAAHPEWTRPQRAPKGRKNKRIALTKSAIYFFRVQRERLEKLGQYRPDGPVFPTQSGDWRNDGSKTIEPRIFRELAAEAGLPDVEKWSPHSMRHSFATLAIVASQGDLTRVQALMRHADISTTKGYFHRISRGLVVSPLALPHPGDRDLAPPPPEYEPPRKLAEIDREAFIATLEATRASADAFTLSPEERLLDVAHVTSKVASTFEARRERRAAAVDLVKRYWRKRSRTPFFADAWAAWREQIGDDAELLRLVREGRRPPPLSEWSSKCYDKAYVGALRRGRSKEDAKIAGTASRRAFLAAWARALPGLLELSGLEQAKRDDRAALCERCGHRGEVHTKRGRGRGWCRMCGEHKCEAFVLAGAEVVEKPKAARKRPSDLDAVIRVIEAAAKRDAAKAAEAPGAVPTARLSVRLGLVALARLRATEGVRLSLESLDGQRLRVVDGKGERWVSEAAALELVRWQIDRVAFRFNGSGGIVEGLGALPLFPRPDGTRRAFDLVQDRLFAEIVREALGTAARWSLARLRRCLDGATESERAAFGARVLAIATGGAS